MQAHDLHTLATEAPVNARGPALGTFDGRRMAVSRFSEHPRWEIHPNGDELLHVIDGELELTLLTDDGPVEHVLGPGAVCVVPRDTWHSPMPRGTVALLAVADYEGSAVSDDADPR